MENTSVLKKDPVSASVTDGLRKASSQAGMDNSATPQSIQLCQRMSRLPR